MVTDRNKVDELFNQIKSMDDSGKFDEVNKKISNLTEESRLLLFLTLANEQINLLNIFNLETELWKQIKLLFKGSFKESLDLTMNYNLSLSIGEVALINSIIDLEEYRTLIRFLYTSTSESEKIITALNISILRYLKAQSIDKEILFFFSRMLRFIGIPLAQVEDIKDFLQSNFLEAKVSIANFLELPISTVQRYPQYIEEMGENFNYDNIVPSLKQWLDNSSLSQIETSNFLQLSESLNFSNVDSPEELLRRMKKELEEKCLTSLPISYQTVIKPYIQTLIPKQIKQNELSSNIPKEILPSYVEKLAYSYSSSKDHEIKVFFLGGAQIGSTGIIISTPNSNILIDFGISVANYQLPIWNERLNHLDAILVSHAHLDHSGGLPYLYAHGYNGYVFGSGITKTLIGLLIKDNMELMNKNITESIRTSDHRFRYLSQSRYFYQMLESYLPISQSVELQITPDIVVKAFNANHIQGSLSYLIETHGKSIFFSGDVNLGSSVLFGNNKLHLPTDSDLTIIDSTYYGHKPINYSKRDELLQRTIIEEKRVIIPAFSVGRAQELMIKLDEMGLTSQRKVSMIGMATKVARATGLTTKGFLSDFLDSTFEDEIIITGGGMLNGGFARELAEQTKDDPSTAIVLCGYLAKTTLGYRLLNKLEPEYRQKIVYTRFSGHSSHEELFNYLKSVSGQKVLVHMGELTKGPFEEDKKLHSKAFKNSPGYIPPIGSSISI